MSDQLADNQQVDVTAPGYFALRTTPGHLRAKGTRIYLIPYSFDREYFDTVYLHPTFLFYSIPIYQWARNPIQFQARGQFLSDASAMRSLTTAMASMNGLLERVDSPLRMALGGGGNADLTIELNGILLPSEPILFYSSLGPPERGTTNSSGGRFFAQGQIFVRDLSTASRTNLLYRTLFRIVAPAAGRVSPNRGFLSLTGYEGFEAPNADEVAILRAYLNRCGGGQFLGAFQSGFEDERLVTPCVTPLAN